MKPGATIIYEEQIDSRALNSNYKSDSKDAIRPLPQDNQISLSDIDSQEFKNPKEGYGNILSPKADVKSS